MVGNTYIMNTDSITITQDTHELNHNNTGRTLTQSQ